MRAALQTSGWACVALSLVAGGAALTMDTVEGIETPLTDSPGNPARGKLIVAEAASVTCLICHTLPLPNEPDMGEIGPPLIGVGSRLSEAEIRQRIVDPKVMDPDTIMPSYFRTERLFRVGEAYRGQTIYTAQEVEDVVAYLVSLKEAQ